MLCKNIVVVTCEKHWVQCRALLDSIDFWLSGFEVVVVDNTPEPINLKYNILYFITFIFYNIECIVFLTVCFGLLYLGDNQLIYIFSVFISSVLLFDSVISAFIVFYLSI
jgi:hypothetical protein